MCSCATELPASADADFKILWISDIHIQNHPRKDAKLFRTLELMADGVKPDLLVLTGDLTSEYENRPAFETFAAFAESLCIPWAFVFGNHDAEGRASKPELDAFLSDPSLRYCIYESGPPMKPGAGSVPATAPMGHYRYSVCRSDWERPAAVLLFMDSGSGLPKTEAAAADRSLDRFGDYDCFHEDQIEWYENEIEAVRREFGAAKSSDVPTLAFFHIPTKEFIAEYDAARRENRVLDGASREHLERTGCSWKDDGMYEAMVRLGSTKGIFVGHDHMKNYTILSRDGIRMTYAYSGDHNIYLVPKTGGTLIRVKQDGSFTTTGLYRLRGGNRIYFGKEIR